MPPPESPPPAAGPPPDAEAGLGIQPGSPDACVATDDCNEHDTATECGCRTVDGANCNPKHCCSVQASFCVGDTGCCFGFACEGTPFGTCQ